jgi:hypothetical protein
MRIGPWICAALVAFGIFRWYSTRELDRAPGIIAVEEPTQSRIDSGDDVERDGFRLVPRAEFSATVRVLHREDYSAGPLAGLVPTDFAVGWGPMSDSSVLADIEISQGNRFYYWRTERWPIERRDIEIHSANWHVIPENDSVRKVLAGVRVGSLVEFRGRLVDIEGGEGGMRTSLTRDDTGAGACEIILASSARIRDSAQ